MVSDTLYIIGNGFDLHHGLKTSYKDFRDKEVKKIRFLNDSLSDIYGEHIYDDMWWNVFENNLAHIDYNNLLGMNNGMALGASRASAFFKNNLGVFFENWINDVDSSIDKQSIKNQVEGINSNAQFFNFNYTRTLEKVYMVPRENIWYIHNSVHDIGKGEQHPIVGHDSNRRMLFTNRQNYKKEHKNLGDAIYDKIDEAALNGAKNVLQRIKVHNDEFHARYSDIKHFIIMGFSFNEIDMPYIKKIMDVNKNINETSWTIYYHQEGEDCKVKELLVSTYQIKESQLQFVKW